MRLIRKLAVLGLAAGMAASWAPALVRADESTPVVKITANKFHFSPDHITLLKGQPVRLQLTSTDVKHGFMIRALKIDTDVKPGQVTEFIVSPATAGTFKAICDHYCGVGHGGMKMTVVVKESSTKVAAAKGLNAPLTTE